MFFRMLRLHHMFSGSLITCIDVAKRSLVCVHVSLLASSIITCGICLTICAITAVLQSARNHIIDLHAVVWEARNISQLFVFFPNWSLVIKNATFNKPCRQYTFVLFPANVIPRMRCRFYHGMHIKYSFIKIWNVQCGKCSYCLLC
jgi:hypothetical protein